MERSEGLKNWLEVYRHDYRYSISVEIIQAYHQTIEHVFISSPGVQSMGGKGYEEFFPVFADKSQHTRFIASRGHGCRNCPFGDFQRIVDSTGTGAEVDGS